MSMTICKTCHDLLTVISGARCSRCSRKSDRLKCTDCIKWEQFPTKDTLRYNYSIYQYNECMQEIIMKWKYRGDYELGYIFKNAVRTHFRKMMLTAAKTHLAIPVPLSIERYSERGFNQAEMLARFLPIPMAAYLQRVTSEVQAKKTRRERMGSANPFQLKKPINKPVILVDDIYTTGTTLRHAAKVLLEHGCPEVISFTLIRS